jgi:hypothetical protein
MGEIAMPLGALEKKHLLTCEEVYKATQEV